MKKQNELTEKLTKKVDTLEGHIIILEGKLAVSETVSKLLGKRAYGLEAHSRIPCLLVPGVKKEKNENMENLTNWNRLEYQRRTENQYRQTTLDRTLSTQYQYTTCDR